MALELPPPWDSDPTEPIPPDLEPEEVPPGGFEQPKEPPTEPGPGTRPEPPLPEVVKPTPLPLILPAFFGGYRLRTLAKTPSETTFGNSVGLGVVAISGFSALGGTVAVADVAQKSPLSMWWVGAVWWIVMAFVVERLVLQITTSKHWRAALAGLLMRLAFSGLVAGGVAECVVVLFNGPEIRNQIVSTQAAQVAAATKQTDGIYDGRINADYRQIKAIQTHENALTAKVDHYRALQTCEAGAAACSQSGKVGEGAYWANDRRQANAYQAQLTAIEPADRDEIKNLRADIAAQRAAKERIVSERVGAIDGGAGFVARMEALSAVEKAHRIVWLETWFLRVFFFFVDMLPVGSKFLRAWSLDSPYDAMLAAERRQDHLPAKRLEGDCEVAEDGIKHSTTARKDSNRFRIYAQAHRDMGGSVGGPDSAGFEPVDAWSFSSFVDHMTAHESRSVTVPPELRRAGYVALLTAAGVGLADVVWTLLNGSMFAGTWLIAGTLAALTGLAALTRGFRRTPSWGLRAIYGGLIASFALPVAVLGLQLV